MRRDAVVKAGGVGLLAGACLGTLGGISPGWAVLVGVLVTAVALAGLMSPQGVDQIWTPLPDVGGSTTELQAAVLASRLFEAAAQPSRYRTRLQPRLGALALARVRRSGIDELADPRAVAVLGLPLYRLVTDPDAVLPDPQTAASLFAELEQA